MKDNVIVPEKAPWDAKPGLSQKLEVDETKTMFEDWDDDSIPFDEENRENDMEYDYKAARRNAHFCVHVSKKILDMIAQNLQYDHNPLVADACVKLIKVMSENNRDIMKLHKDFKTTKLIGKPKVGEESAADSATPQSEEERKDKVQTTVSEVIAAAKAAKENEKNVE
jgi:hypothetical protein